MSIIDSQEFKVAPARYENIADITVLEKLVYPKDAYPALFFYQALRQWPETFLIVKSKELVAGYSLLVPVSDSALSLMSVLVGKQYQGKGLGAKLLRESLVLARSLNYQRIELSVSPDNESAIALYNRLGFKEAESVRDYLGPGQDRLVMVLLL
ncbi:GNAT family N-acetyltransferase [Pseudidiomarina salinarum]|uniref:GNAT family N-acetyltransferase n=1 Tax=Pseudidiomarina salinarum TaxID=435908 RepID=UPI000691E629|nr:GNAT family N-acetyltransferase [Pseudidiomarina salinarum]RUO70351.1 GNAT family N-acetyltransferase [Pseudidiomarina salinarum]